MSYRNDHDAALHRVAALEGELARLKAQRGVRARDEEEPGGESKLMTILVSGALVMLAVAFLVWRATRSYEKPPAATYDMTMSTKDAGSCAANEACAHAIDARAVRDARAADPRGEAPVPVSTLMTAPPVCGGGAAAIPSNESSLITVYYESDPVALDGYATAEQLWREYHRARAATCH